LVLTNAHVATTRIGDRMNCIFNLGGFNERTFVGENLIAAYSERNAVDWAIVFVPGLTAESGIKPVKLHKEAPVGSTFTFTGSPRCVWPQTTVKIRLVNSNVPGVVMWQPPTIGGQSGSSVWWTINDERVAQILLTWWWGGNGAGQPTSLIWNNRLNRSNEGPERPAGQLKLPPFNENGGNQVGMEDRQCEDGYFESPSVGGPDPDPGVLLLNVGVKELPIWYSEEDPVDPPPPNDDLTEAELAAVLKLKAGGFDLVKVAELHLNLIMKPQVDLMIEPMSMKPRWTPPALKAGELYKIGQIHNGYQLTQRRCADGEDCVFEWVKISQEE